VAIFILSLFTLDPNLPADDTSTRRKVQLIIADRENLFEDKECKTFKIVSSDKFHVHMNMVRHTAVRKADKRDYRVHQHIHRNIENISYNFLECLRDS
jgi:hypothetical protein